MDAETAEGRAEVAGVDHPSGVDGCSRMAALMSHTRRAPLVAVAAARRPSRTHEEMGALWPRSDVCNKADRNRG